MTKNKYNRRQALKLGASAAAAVSALDLVSSKAHAQAAQTAPAEKLLFVITATGGGSIMDSLLAQRESDVSGAGGNPSDLICYEDQFVQLHGGVNGQPGTEIRSLNFPLDAGDPNSAYRNVFGLGTLYAQSQFVSAHLDDLAVMTVENTSVNHFIAQHRAITGAGIDSGRTLGERVAERYGQGLPLPHVNMANGGYLEPGLDPTVEAFARHEPVVVPSLFPLSADGVRGAVGAPGAQPGLAPQPDELTRSRELVARARSIRDQLDDASSFGQTFQCAPLRQRYLAQRAFAAQSIEPADLITNLMYLSEIPIAPFGLDITQEAIDARTAVTTMPGGMDARSPFFDPFYGQVLLAYLLARYGYSTAVTLGVPFSTDVNNVDVNPPLSFDFSHNNHVAGQSQMWSRVLDGADKLISLLKSTPVPGGGTMWDRSLVYIAADFGRDKVRSSPGTPLIQGTSTGHHLNNGAILASPLLNGGRVYGGVDPTTLLTHGFNRSTGVADPSAVMREGDIYSVICQALGVNFAGRQDIPCMITGA